jgi:Tfp pilus assembly protein PilX
MSFLKEKIILSPAYREKDGRSGFALILCLALMSVVFLFVLSMMSLVSLELRQSQLRKKSVLAKTHARYGLSVAL